jgi:hypothetical protein
MGVTTEAMDSFAALLEGLTPETRPDLKFKHIKVANFDNLPKVPKSHRKFTLEWEGHWTQDPQGGLGALRVMFVNQVIGIHVRYMVEGRQPYDAFNIMTEDADLIIRTLETPTNYYNYNGSGDKVIKVDVDGDVERAFSPEEGSAHLLLGFKIKYRRT